MRLDFVVLEDCGGGLHLAVFDAEDRCIYFASGGEQNLQDLADSIKALLAGDHPLRDGWELEGAFVGGEAQQAYEDLISYSYGWGIIGQVIAGDYRLYPSRVGAAGERLLGLIPCAGEKVIIVVADEEYNAEEWWDAARSDGNAPACIAQWLQQLNMTPLHLTPAEADEVRKWAAGLPGWDDGPAHAPHPLLFCED